MRERRRIEAGLAEMLGIARGVVADGRVSAEEATGLAEWARRNPDVASRWPANLLTRRLERIFRDGKVDARERKYLGAILGKLAFGPGDLGVSLATDLPVDRPPPEIRFDGCVFVFAGEMAYGPHRSCEREVVDLGGSCERSVTRRTNYVVIGQIAAESWSQEGFCEVLDEVAQHRARGAEVAVISEEHWVAALP